MNDKLRISSKGGQERTACGTGSSISGVFKGDEVYIEFATNGANTNGGFMLTYKLSNISTSAQGTWKSFLTGILRRVSRKTETDCLLV